jgi:hypothetical protein
VTLILHLSWQNRRPLISSAAACQLSLNTTARAQKRQSHQLPPQKAKHRPSRTRSSSNEFTSSKQLVFTPAQVYPIATSRSTTAFLSRKSASSPLLFDSLVISPPPYSQHSPPQQILHHMNPDTEDDQDDVGMIYTSPHIGSQTSCRKVYEVEYFGWRRLARRAYVISQ